MLAFAYRHEVIVEEIDIQACLEHSGQYLCPAIEIIYKVSVDPIHYVEESIETQCGYIVRGDILNQSDFVKHHDLRDECNRL